MPVIRCYQIKECSYNRIHKAGLSNRPAAIGLLPGIILRQL